jgi:hypothetical protein
VRPPPIRLIKANTALMKKPRRLPKFENSLEGKYPQVAVIFDFELNKPRIPSEYFPKSDFVINWRCQDNLEHKWERIVKEQVRMSLKGNDCPYCSKKWPSPEYSLAACYPDLVPEWNVELNDGLKPTEVLLKSDKVVWWNCPNDPDHVYDMQVKKRTERGYNCPYCVNRRMDRKKSFGALYPELLEEWHPTRNRIDPFTISPRNDYRPFWVCKNDPSHVWEAQIKNRTNAEQPTGCPYCANKLASRTNTLEVNFPEIANQWHPTKNGELTPLSVTFGTYKKVWWQCSLGHEWEATPSSRTNKLTGCPHCSPTSSKPEMYVLCELEWIFDDVKHQDRTYGYECDVYLPKHSIGIEIDGSYWHKGKEKLDKKKTKELKKNGVTLIRLREFPLQSLSKNDVIYHDKVIDFTDVVALLKALLNFNLALSEEELVKVNEYLKKPKQRNAKRFHERIVNLSTPSNIEDSAASSVNVLELWDYEENYPLRPENFTRHSSFEISWKCNKGLGHDNWTTRISHIFKGNGCPSCSGNIAHTENCLATLYPELTKLWSSNNELKPTEVTAYSAKEALWQCDKGHEYLRAINTQVIGKRTCPDCQSLGCRFPELAKQLHPLKNGNLTALDIPAKSTIEFWWICEHSTEWKESPHARLNKSSNTQCLKCQSDFKNQKKEQKQSGNETLLEHTIASMGQVDIKNSAATSQKIVELWSYEKNAPLTPESVPLDSELILSWMCKRGHDFDAKVCNIAHTDDCYICKANPATPENSLAGQYPEVAKLWSSNNKIKPTEVTAKSRHKFLWVCSNNHEYERSVLGQTKGIQSCPICVSLGHRFPHLIPIWHSTKNGELTPFGVNAKSTIKVWWQCEHGTEWEETPHSKSQKVMNSQCKACATQHRLESAAQRKAQNTQLFSRAVANIGKLTIEDSAAVDKAILSLWDYEKNSPLFPEHVSIDSELEVDWICRIGHKWKKKINKMQGHDQCPQCKLHPVTKKNCLATTHPHVAKLWSSSNTLTTTEVTPNLKIKVLWKCENNHEYERGIHTQTKGTQVCNVCQSIGYKYPELNKEWHPTKNGELTLFDVAGLSSKSIWWLCVNGHEWQETPFNRTNRANRNCPHCQS